MFERLIRDRDREARRGGRAHRRGCCCPPGRSCQRRTTRARSGGRPCSAAAPAHHQVKRIGTRLRNELNNRIARVHGPTAPKAHKMDAILLCLTAMGSRPQTAQKRTAGKRMPALATMAVRPWMSSACWYHLSADGDAPRPAGSKPKSPARLHHGRCVVQGPDRGCGERVGGRVLRLTLVAAPAVQMLRRLATGQP